MMVTLSVLKNLTHTSGMMKGVGRLSFREYFGPRKPTTMKTMKKKTAKSRPMKDPKISLLPIRPNYESKPSRDG